MTCSATTPGPTDPAAAGPAAPRSGNRWALPPASTWSCAIPDLVRALVIITPAHRGAPSPNLARWDALAEGLEQGGVDGFLAAYGPPQVPARMAETVRVVMRQRLERHAHPEGVAAALRAHSAVGGVRRTRGARAAAGPDAHRREPRRDGPGASPGGRRGVRAADSGRGVRDRGGGPEPARLARRKPVADRRRVPRPRTGSARGERRLGQCRLGGESQRSDQRGGLVGDAAHPPPARRTRRRRPGDQGAARGRRC